MCLAEPVNPPRPTDRTDGAQPAWGDASDSDLAVAAALGDSDAFTEIFHRHGHGMYRYAVRMMEGDHAAAQDVVQEAWTKAWQGLPKFRDEAQLSTWLFRITANEALSARRRRRPRPADDQLLEQLSRTDRDTTVEGAHSLQLQRALDQSLLELPWRQRATWILREMEGMSYVQIAEILRTNPTVVRGQLHRARRTLAVKMVQWS